LRIGFVAGGGEDIIGRSRAAVVLGERFGMGGGISAV